MSNTPIVHVDSQGRLISYDGMIRDITERKRAEDRRHLAHDVLNLLNHPGGIKDTIGDILCLIKKTLGIEAVGIRLNDGEDFPYYVTDGFSEEFVRAEKYLCKHDSTGKIERDGQGNPVLECMCGNVLCGRTDAALPFFTTGGSFWTNSTTDLPASTTKEDRKGRTRKGCNGEGYESVALVPFRSGADIMGLLQLNDPERDRFTSETIRFLEGLGNSIGIALSRRRAEEARARLAAIVESSDDAVIGKDLNGTIVSWNKGAEKIYGYTAESVIKKSISILAPSDYVDEVSALLDRIRHGQNIEHYETVRIRKDGDRISVSLAISPIRDATGEIIGASTIARDITERKKAEEKLLTSQLQLVDAADMARIAYWEYDEATGEIILNDVFYGLFGTTAEREGGYRMTREEHLRRFVHPDDLEGLRRHVDETRARPRTGDIEQYEHRAIRGDGEVVHILTRNRVVLDSKGRVLKIVGVNQDITGRKKMEEALRESEERYRTLFENSLDGIMLTQPDGTILAANRHACEMLRMTEEEILRAGRGGVVVDDERLRAAVAERAKTGKWHGELTLRRPDGSNFPVEISSRVFAGTDGREMTAMVLRDNSERKLAEQALHEAEDKYRSLFSEMAYGAALHEVVTDSEGHAVDYVTLEVNGAFESLLGCRKEAVTGKRASDILPPDELRHWLDIFGPVALLGTSCRYEVYSPLNNKHFEGTAYSPGEGKFAVVFSDVTDRKEAQNQLEEKEERFRKIFDESPLGIVIVGSDHRFARANAAFCRMLGYTEEELIKLTFKDVTHPDHIAQDTLHVNQLVSGEIPLYRTEKRYVRKDKEIVWGSSTSPLSTTKAAISCTFSRWSKT